MEALRVLWMNIVLHVDLPSDLLVDIRLHIKA